MTTAETPVKELVLTRVFCAPRELVFRAWADPRMFARWWGPRGFTNPVCELDVRPGGAIRVHMRGPDGAIYPMGGAFREIDPPERLAFTTMALAHPGGPPVLEALTTVLFEEQGGVTKITLRAQVLRAVPEMAGALEGMEQGWAESLYRLADVLDGEGGGS